MKNSFKISGFTCGACAKLAQKRLEKIKGIHEVQVNAEGQATVSSDTEITKEEIQNVLNDTNYKVL